MIFKALHSFSNHCPSKYQNSLSNLSFLQLSHVLNMEPPPSSSKSHNKHKSIPTPANSNEQQRKKQNPRNPLKDFKCNINSSSSNASTSISIEAPKGCLRLILSHTSFSSRTHINKPVKTLSKTKTTPKSAPIASKRTVFDNPISQKPLKVKKNAPCLYQWQSGKKPSSKSNKDSVLDSSGSPVNRFPSGSQDLQQDQLLCAISVANDKCNDDANLTPVSKVATASGLVCRVNDDDEDGKSNTTGKSNTKTPPVQPSVSPEIQCGSTLLSTKTATTTTTTPACYGAGYVLSGVSDKRKCRPRGILTVGGDNNDLLAFGKAKDFNIIDNDDDDDDDDDDDHIDKGAVNNSSSVSMVPLPSEASVHWLLSPCNEEDEDQKENSENGSFPFRRLEHSSSLTSSNHGFSLGLCKSNNDSRSTATDNNRRQSTSLFSPSELTEFREFWGSLNDNVVLPSSPHVTTPSGEAADLEEGRKYRYDLGGDSTPFSADLLGSGNVMCTPQSDSGSDRCVGLSCLIAEEDHKKHHLDSPLNLVFEDLQLESLSPKRHVSIWDPTNSSFQFDCFTTPSTSVDLCRLQKILDDRTSWFSDSTSENVPESHMRISWREGLMSRIFEMDEFDSCRCLSDEDEDVNGSCDEKLRFCQSPELNINAEKDNYLTNGCGSEEFLDNEPIVDGNSKDRHPPLIACSCAESISTDGGGLIASGDSDWSLCYKNELFQV
ncbi:hypothetical protein CFOL_v3_10664 [Cephalotus follicularis]|uniref:Uncharacterized protein n=1 Tax=Cephalotus follicularis TaxID=3775 RepID=A0A1Q3BGT8_CEPFO|nr:hypothetical protein CFOL_v3_10664 [Cephalotus follicularis]